MVLVPATGLAGGLLGVLLAQRPLLALVLAILVGSAAALLLSRPIARDVDRLVARMRGYREGEADRLPTFRVRDPEWRRLAEAVDALGGSLGQRLDDLATERERVVRLLEGLGPAILLFTGGELAYANANARRLFGLSSGNRARTPMQVLGLEALADAVEEAARTGRDVSAEGRRDERALAGRASTTTAGEVALVVTDLTETRRIEAVRRDFVTNASHELKTPVAGLQALAESLGLALAHDPERGRRMVVRMQREASRLASLVRELLDLARLEEGDGGASRQRVDVCRVVRAQLERVGPLAAERRVSLDWQLPEPAMVDAAPEDVRLIVGNLVDNAVQYSREDGWMRARVHREGDVVQFEVTDNGVGIPEADQDRIFERFYRVDKGRSRAAGGTGLGLALVRHAVARHGGEVEVSSVLGEGTTFTVRLPCADPGRVDGLMGG